MGWTHGQQQGPMDFFYKSSRTAEWQVDQHHPYKGKPEEEQVHVVSYRSSCSEMVNLFMIWLVPFKWAYFHRSRPPLPTIIWTSHRFRVYLQWETGSGCTYNGKQVQGVPTMGNRFRVYLQWQTGSGCTYNGKQGYIWLERIRVKNNRMLRFSILVPSETGSLW